MQPPYDTTVVGNIKHEGPLYVFMAAIMGAGYAAGSSLPTPALSGGSQASPIRRASRGRTAPAT